MSRLPPVRMWTTHTCSQRPKEGMESPGVQVRQLWATVWVLWIHPRSSGRAASAVRLTAEPSFQPNSAQFVIRLFGIFLSGWRSSLCVVGIRPSSDRRFENVPSRPTGSSFHLAISSYSSPLPLSAPELKPRNLLEQASWARKLPFKGSMAPDFMFRILLSTLSDVF